MLLAYGVSLDNGYSLDDDLVLNERTQEGDIASLFSEKYYMVNGKGYDYRPIVMISFALEHRIIGESAAGSHLVNLILYFFVCLAVYHFLRRLLGEENKLILYAALLIFVLHPIHSEVILSLKNRDELLASLFGFLAVNLFIQIKDFSFKSILQWLGFAALMCLALMSKLSALQFVIIAVLSDLYLRPIKLAGIKIIAAYIPRILFNLIKRGTLGKGNADSRSFHYFENPLYSMDLNVLEKIPIGSYILLKYIALFIIPYPLRFYYGYDQVSITPWDTTAGVLAFIVCFVLVAFSIYLFYKKNIIGYGLVFFFATGAAFSNMLKPLVGIMGERFVFVPILGLCIAAAGGLALLAKKFGTKKIVQVVVLPLTIVFIGLNINRSGDWNSRMSLYEADIAHLEKSAKANFLYAHELQISDEVAKTKDVYEKMIRHYDMSLAVYPDYKEAANNAGWVYFDKLKNVQMAKPYFKKALNTDSLFSEAHHGMGAIYHTSKQYDSAIYHYRLAYDLKPKMMLATAKYKEFVIYMEQKNSAKLIEVGREMLSDGVEHEQTFNFIGNGHFYADNIDSALYYFDKAYDVNPTTKQGAHIFKMAQHYGKNNYYRKYQKYSTN